MPPPERQPDAHVPPPLCWLARERRRLLLPPLVQPVLGRNALHPTTRLPEVAALHPRNNLVEPAPDRRRHIESLHSCTCALHRPPAPSASAAAAARAPVHARVHPRTEVVLVLI
eukprot:scaffold14088_cov146-Isochrysis_galbana.AAC.1